MKKIYTIEVEHMKDGRMAIRRTCDGFNSHELLGILFETQIDIINQRRGDKPIFDLVERRVVKEGMEERIKMETQGPDPAPKKRTKK